MGQDHVIRDVVDTLSMVKAQLTPSDKPIASMLFIGPTGVGKTEMAKSIAEFLFSDPNRLVRIDMSEMNTPLAIERLVGGPGRETGLLVRKIREQPFSVLLLDEFEKADPIVFDLLLQVLGEGRLTDVDGNRADFSNCIVIMTSNLGVDSFRPQPFGFGSDDPDQTESLAAEQPSDSEIRMSLDANDSSPKSDTDTHPDRSSNPVTTRYSEHFVRKTQEFLRPELFNRIDRIIAFSPLGPAETQQIARRHLELIRRREGLDLRGVTIEADEDVIAHLAATGFHPRYGARALHRAFEQQLLRPLASALSAYGVGVQVNANATMVSGKIAVAVKATQPSSKDAPNDRPPSEVVARATKLRRNGQALDKCGAILKHRNELEQARQTLSTTEKRLKRNDRQPLREYRSKLLHIVKTRQRTLESVTRIVTETQGIEERTLLAAYGKETWNQVEAEQEIDVIESKLRAMLMSLTTGGRSSDVRSTTVVFFENSKDAAYLLRAWKQLAIENDWRGSGYYIKPYNKKSDPDPSGKKNTPKDRRLDDSQKPSLHLFARKQSDKPDEPREKILDAFHVSAIDQLFEPPSGAIGWAVQWQGDRAHLLLGSESGQHTFRCDGEARRVLVEETTQMLVGYDAPPKINRATSDSMAMADARRFYDFESRTIDDIFLGTTVQWQKNRLEKSIVDSMNQGLENRLWKLLDEDYTSVNVWPDAEIVITN